MKLIIVLISLVAFALSDSTFDNEVMTLNEIYTMSFQLIDAKAKKDGSSITQLFVDADRECVKEKLNLAANGDKTTTLEIGPVLVGFASTLCSREDHMKLMSSFFDEKMENFSSGDDKATNVFCIKKKIQEIIDNVEGEAIEKCKPFDSNYQALNEKFEGNLQLLNSLGISECVNFDATSWRTSVLNTAVSYMDEPRDEEAYENARANYVDKVISLTGKIVDCLVKKITE